MKERNGEDAPGRAASVSSRCGASRGRAAQAVGHGLGQGQPALEGGDRPPVPELFEEAVALAAQPGPPRRGSREPRVVRQDGQKGRLGPAQLVRAPAEVEPRGRVESDDVAAERRVGREQGQDPGFGQAGLEPQGQPGLAQLFGQGPRPVLPGQADDLHGDRARAALDPARPDVLTHRPGHGQRVDAGVGEEALVLETDEHLGEPSRDAFARREAPLAVGGRPGPEQPALGAEQHRRDGIVEADDGHLEPEKQEKKARAAGDEEAAAFEEGDMSLWYVSPAFIPRFHWMISTHCPFVLACRPASYIASTATPGW